MEAQRPTAVGEAAHAIIGALAGQMSHLPRQMVTAEAFRVGAEHLRGTAPVSRRQAILFEACGFAAAYLRCYIPPPPWTLHAVEMLVHRTDGSGRVDVAWKHPRRGYLLDEIKTCRIGTTYAVQTWIDQAASYVTASLDARLVGVRLLVLGALNTSMFIPPDLGVIPLVGSAGDPERLESGTK